MRAIAGALVVVSAAIILGATLVSDSLDGSTGNRYTTIALLLGFTLVVVGLFFIAADRNT